MATQLIDDNSNKILDDYALVRSDIYCVENTVTGKKYVGQARTHRLNHGRYRPFGAEARFRHHISEALCNTKHKTGHLLGVDIRAYGKDAFKVSVLETCDKEKADEREIYWISALNTVYPHGYNIALGGSNTTHPPGVAPIPNTLPLATPKKRGGSTMREESTRAKMAERAKEVFGTTEMKAVRASIAKSQHAAAKAARFAGVTIDPTNLDQYISVRKQCILVRVSGQEARFASKTETPEELMVRAKEFLQSLIHEPVSNEEPAAGAGKSEE